MEFSALTMVMLMLQTVDGVLIFNLVVKIVLTVLLLTLLAFAV